MSIWSEAIESAIARETLVRPSEMQPNMLVQRILGSKLWRVMGCHSLDYVPYWLIHLQDENGYDDFIAYQIEGVNDKSWKLIGWTK
jgi:hypothetical protein